MTNVHLRSTIHVNNCYNPGPPPKLKALVSQPWGLETLVPPPDNTIECQSTTRGYGGQSDEGGWDGGWFGIGVRDYGLRD